MSDQKKKRLFVRTDESYFDVACVCGGPDIGDAMTGLMHTLRPIVDDLFKQPGTAEVSLFCVEMTDAEVETLPDV